MSIYFVRSNSTQYFCKKLSLRIDEVVSCVLKYQNYVTIFTKLPIILKFFGYLDMQLANFHGT